MKFIIKLLGLLLYGVINTMETTNCNDDQSDKDVFCLENYPQLRSPVKVNYGGYWIPLCANVWLIDGADEVCRRIYGSNASSVQLLQNDMRVGQLAMVDWECFLCEDCTNCITQINTNDCEHVAVVDCQDVRLAFNEQREGMIQTYANYTWGSICPLTWNLSEASVACKQLYSCPAQDALAKSTYLGIRASLTPINARYYICYGQEGMLNECSMGQPLGMNTCPYEDERRAGVICRSTCYRPSLSKNMLISPDSNDYALNERVTISCEQGYRLDVDENIVEHNVLTCQPNCSWTKQGLECKPFCSAPDPVTNGTITPDLEFYDVGSTITVKCDEGFELVGYSQITCQRTSWSQRFPKCVDLSMVKSSAQAYLDTLPAIVAGSVMAIAFTIALISFLVLVILRASEKVVENENIPSTTRQEVAPEAEEDSVI